MLLSMEILTAVGPLWVLSREVRIEVERADLIGRKEETIGMKSPIKIVVINTLGESHELKFKFTIFPMIPTIITAAI